MLFFLQTFANLYKKIIIQLKKAGLQEDLNVCTRKDTGCLLRPKNMPEEIFRTVESDNFSEIEQPRRI